MSRPQLSKTRIGIDVQSQATSSKRSPEKDETEEDHSSDSHSDQLAAHDEEENDDDTSSSNITSSSDSEDGTDEDITQGQDIPASAPGLEAKPVQTADLRSKLSAFLPQIAQANEKLAAGTTERVDDVADDEEHYIEMNLGLGVLTEKSNRKRRGEIRFEESSSSSDDTSISSEDVEEENEQDSNIMKTLKGESTKFKRRKIEELG